MTWVLTVIAALCLIYYIVIVLYSGFTTSFSAVWLLGSIVLALTAVGREFYRHNRDRVPLWVPVSVATVLCTGIVIFAVTETLVFMGVASADTPGLDYIIVLGARLKVEEGVSNSLKKRLDKAILYLERNPDTVLVLSGGREHPEMMSEAEAMEDYLKFNGVAEENMILEQRSHSTVENIAYSRVAIEEDQARRRRESQSREGLPEPGGPASADRPLRIGVLTSDFHVFRAEKIAKKWGIPDIQGVSCESDPVLFLHFCVRECAAILKDKLMGNM